MWTWSGRCPTTARFTATLCGTPPRRNAPHRVPLPPPPSHPFPRRLLAFFGSICMWWEWTSVCTLSPRIHVHYSPASENCRGLSSFVFLAFVSGAGFMARSIALQAPLLSQSKLRSGSECVRDRPPPPSPPPSLSQFLILKMHCMARMDHTLLNLSDRWPPASFQTRDLPAAEKSPF